MVLRGFWIFSKQPSKEKCIFVKKFPTVEKQTKIREKDQYVQIPAAEKFAEFVETAWQDCLLGGDQESFGKQPVISVKTPQGEIWPLLVVEQAHYYFCILPSVEEGSHTRPPLIQIPGLSLGFSLLLGIIEFLGVLPRNTGSDSTRLAELNQFLLVAAPFGTPLDVSPVTVKATISSKGSSTAGATIKHPAWKPMQYKGKAQLHFAVREQIRAALYDSSEEPNVWDVHGTVMCRADLEGISPDISVSFSHGSNTAHSIPLQHLVVHPFVQSVENQGSFAMGQGRMDQGHCKVRFTPPLDNFPLLHYTASTSHQGAALPINGFYQMKGKSKVELLLQLQLNETVKNNFEYFEVQMPFYNRGQIKSFDATPNHGNVVCSKDKTILIWNIGQRFPSKSLEVILKATLSFVEVERKFESAKTAEECFCVGQNAYVQLVFKILDYTHTAIQLDTKSVQVLPNTKYKLSSNREFLSGEYRIWNSHGDALRAFVPPDSLLQDICTEKLKPAVTE